MPPSSVERFNAAAEDICLIPAFNANACDQSSTTKELQSWVKTVADLGRNCSVLQAQIDEGMDPNFANGFCQVLDESIPTVFLHSTAAPVVQPLPSKSRFRHHHFRFRRHRLFRDCVKVARHADLSLFDSEQSMRQYTGFTRNAKLFPAPVISTADVLDEASLRKRLSGDSLISSLRLVSSIPLERQNGLGHAIAIIRQARSNGANVTLDIYGDGLQKSELQYQIAKLGLTNSVRLNAPLQNLAEDRYANNQQVVARLNDYDAMLITPLGSDPKTETTAKVFNAIWQGYAAGLPIIGFDQPSIRQQLVRNKTGILLPCGDITAAAMRIAELDLQRGQLHDISLNARRAAIDQSMETWYSRRAEWTCEAIPRPHTASKSPCPTARLVSA
ncbi:glycosyltransferase [Novipirellula herctigrandis]|uniref:glycosyltransferase n=1 Tax=Novipirellula herctigrandis TaxID=2527986 RepID=UPI003AF33F6E